MNIALCHLPLVEIYLVYYLLLPLCFLEESYSTKYARENQFKLALIVRTFPHCQSITILVCYRHNTTFGG